MEIATILSQLLTYLVFITPPWAPAMVTLSTPPSDCAVDLICQQHEAQESSVICPKSLRAGVKIKACALGQQDTVPHRCVYFIC